MLCAGWFFIRFYLKYIEKDLKKIEANTYEAKSLSSLSEWHTIMGLQFENFMYTNRTLIHSALSLKPDEIITANPYFQNTTRSFDGCQIDYLIQAKFKTLYLCEFKFSQNPVSPSVIKEVQKKINALSYLKAYSFRPVLIHINGVTNEVIEQDFFASIINIADWLR